MKPHVIISGANGNLGQFVVKKFLKENWLVTALVQPGTYLENLEKSDSLKIVMIDLDKESFFKQQKGVNFDKKYKENLGKIKF